LNKKKILKCFKLHFKKDIKIGFFSFFLALPIILFTSHLINFIIFFVFKIKKLPNQLVIDYLKSTYDKPFSFLLATITIVILAPFIEEVLFRGFFQNFLKKYLNVKTSIILTSLIFSIFHFSFYQKFSNISILSSIFILGSLLGFIYEKQKSLIAPITLHLTFNSFSILSLLIFKNFI
jgi:hypothetical protein